MELNKKNVAINITIVPVDPNTYYSTDEDSDSDSENEQQVEQPSTKEAPTSCETRSERGTSETPLTKEASATKSSSSREDAVLEEPSDEPVELIDGLFDFVPFNADEDVLLKDVECNDFDLESYLTDQSNSTRGSGLSSTSSSSESSASTTPSSSGTSAPSTSSSQGTSAATTLSSPGTTESVQKMQRSISKGSTTVDNIRYGMEINSSRSCSPGTSVLSTSSSLRTRTSVSSTSSLRFSASSSSSSPGTSASSTSPLPGTIASVKKMQSSSSKDITTMNNVRFGIGRGKDIRNLLKCYNRKLSPDDKQLLRKSAEQYSKAQFEKKLEVSVKEVKKGELKPTIVRPKNEKETNTTPINEKDLSLIKKKYVEAVTKYRKKKSQSPEGSEEPNADKIGNHKQNSQSSKKNKEPIDEQAGKQKEKSQSPKENKDTVGDQIGKRTEKSQSLKENRDPVCEQSGKRKKSQSPTENKNPMNGRMRKENLQDSAIMDEFTKAILASMEVVQRKPNLEKRKNSEPKKPTLFDEHSSKFQQYLSDKKAQFERTSSQPLLTHNSSNSTLKCGPLPMAIVKNKFLRTEPQRKQDIYPENCKSINNANVKELVQHQQINTLGQICLPNGNVAGLMKNDSLKQQNNIECSSAPTSVRKISIQEYLNRKRPHQSTVSGLDADTDSKNVNKKRITLAEYNQRRVMV